MKKGRKMTKTRFALAALLAMMMFCWSACGGSSSEAYDTMASSGAVSDGYYNDAMGNGLIVESAGDYKADDTYVEEKGEKPSAEESKDGAVFDERKLIKTVDMDVETKEYDRLMAELKDKVSQLGGYIERMDTYNGSSYSYYQSSRSANLTIRIPKNKLNEFVDAVSGISNVVRRSDNVEDVTLSYVDMESRRNTLQTEQERLLTLLAQAESINDIIVIEDRLSTVRYQLESMESRLRTIDNQVDYSTVHLDISEVQELTPVQEQTPIERIVEGFVESLRDIKDDVVEFAIWFVINIPYFVVWGVIITVVVVIVRACRKRRRAKKAAMQNVTGVTNSGNTADADKDTGRME